MAKHFFSSTIAAAFLAIAATNAFAVDAGAISQQAPDQWRASKFAGLSIYGPGNKTVGKISDVLVSKGGKAEIVVVGVGGFLGIGEKDVAIPYDQVKFTDQPMTPPANPEPTNNNMAAPAAGTAMAPNGGVAPATAAGLGTPADTSGNAMAPAGTMAAAPGMAAAPPRNMAYPDHGTIDMTADQLKAAPTFKFAS